MSRLKNLYTQLAPWWRETWHDSYEAFYEEVEKTRDRINNGESLSPDTDKAFLQKLLYEKVNGIASVGRSILEEEHFKSFIADEKFRLSLQQLIVEPNEQNWEDFGKVWSAQEKGNNPARVDRVAAACTLKVSTTVHEEKFNQVFNWLMGKKIIKPSKEDLENWFSKNQFLMGFMHNEFKDEIEEKKIDGEPIDKFYLSMFVWCLWEHIKEQPFSIKKQIVKYGPPGTGKTYKAKEDARATFNSWQKKSALDYNYDYDDHHELVQFHPSFSYEDFIEGLRPVLEDGQVQLKLQNGIFKKFCIKAGQWEIDIYELDKELDWESLTIEDLRNHKGVLEKLDHWKDIFDSNASPESKVMDVVPPYFFIIDEINRAELSRVFWRTHVLL